MDYNRLAELGLSPEQIQNIKNNGGKITGFNDVGIMSPNGAFIPAGSPEMDAYNAYWRGMATRPQQYRGNQATDPYQLPQNKPQYSTANSPGPMPTSTDPRLTPLQNQTGNFSHQNGGPVYNMVNGQPQTIGARSDPAYRNAQWLGNGFDRNMSQGPVPQSGYPTTMTKYKDQIVPMNNQPGRGIGPGGPTRSVPGFNLWNGGNMQPVNPYQPVQSNRPGQRQFKNTVW